MNESQYFEAARHLAQQVIGPPNHTEAERLRIVFELITSRLPNDDEQGDLRAGLDGFRALYREDIDAAQAMTSDLNLTSDAQRIELAAFTMVVNSLFNLDVTKTRE
jgi:hypothetical protein